MWKVKLEKLSDYYNEQLQCWEKEFTNNSEVYVGDTNGFVKIS